MQLALVLLLSSVLVQATSAQSPPNPASSEASSAASAYVPVHKFDPGRDPAADLRAAIAEAQRTGRRILLDVGGDWCPWCHVVDRFYQSHPELAELRDKNFIILAVYYGSDNKNQQFLAGYPKTEAIPHFFVLEKDGTFLYSQGMLKLETGGQPDAEKVKAFLLRWSPPPLQ